MLMGGSQRAAVPVEWLGSAGMACRGVAAPGAQQAKGPGGDGFNGQAIGCALACRLYRATLESAMQESAALACPGAPLEWAAHPQGFLPRV